MDSERERSGGWGEEKTIEQGRERKREKGKERTLETKRKSEQD